MKRNERERHTTFFNLRDALAEKDCAFCALAAKSAHDFLGAMLYENVNDPGTRKPEDIGKTESHGCFRLANWNVETLAQMIEIGTVIVVEE